MILGDTARSTVTDPWAQDSAVVQPSPEALPTEMGLSLRGPAGAKTLESSSTTSPLTLD